MDGRGTTAGTGYRLLPSPAQHPRPVIRPWAPDACALAIGLGLGAAVALPLSEVDAQTLATPAGLTKLAGHTAAMAGTYLLLVIVLMAARIPALETVLGQDRLIRWHRRLAAVPLLLLTAHTALATVAYAESAHLGFLVGAGSLITTVSFMFAAVIAYAMLVAIAVVSIRAIRRRIGYDNWWVVHLYTYLAVAFSVPHQIVDGGDFAGRPLAQGAWLVLWAGTAGVVTIYRIGLPIFRSLRHQLQVVQVRREGPGVFSVLVRGRKLDRLRVAGGQYFEWRFLTRELWWRAHPFSLSAVPTPQYMRVTIKTAGATTAQLAALRPGTRIAIEGPYGTFTDAARTRPKVALIGAGVGITPLRALLDDLPGDVDVVVVQRASNEEHLIHRRELEHMVGDRRGRLLHVVGSRSTNRLDDPRCLERVVPDLATRDLYVCGPDEFSAGVAAAARAIGVAPSAIHRESFG